MQLICNGIPLYLLEGQKIQMTKQNPLFGFDNLTCERSTEITLPDTYTNNAVFAAARNPAVYGRPMRVRYDAQLCDGVIVKEGHLYVSSYTGGAYKAVFVTGQLLGLQRVKQAGKIRDLVDFSSDYVYYPEESPTPANENKHYWEVVRYGQESRPVYPSADLRSVVDAAANGLGVHVDFTGTEPELRYIPDVPHPLSSQAMSISEHVNDPLQPSSNIPSKNYNIPTYWKSGVFMTFSVIVSTMRRSMTMYYKLQQCVPYIDIKLTFPDDFSSNLFLVSFDQDGEHTFLGDYSFEMAGEYPSKFRRTFGEPLAGRSVEIPKQTRFVILDMRDYFDEQVQTPTGTVYDIGWIFGVGGGIGLDYSFDLRIESSDPGVLYLQDNLPDVTLVDLLKTIAAASGRALYYDDANGISFDPVDVKSWPVIELQNILKLDQVERKFSDYQQANLVQFDTAKNVREWQREVLAYVIENDYLEREKVLQTIPFSEGSIGGTNLAPYFLNTNAKEESDKYMLARCLQSYTNMQRVVLPENAGIAELCEASTSVRASVLMSLFEFEQITPKKTIICQNVKYVWTSATWSDGVATFTLAKI